MIRCTRGNRLAEKTRCWQAYFSVLVTASPDVQERCVGAGDEQAMMSQAMMSKSKFLRKS